MLCPYWCVVLLDYKKRLVNVVNQSFFKGSMWLLFYGGVVVFACCDGFGCATCVLGVGVVVVEFCAA